MCSVILLYICTDSYMANRFHCFGLVGFFPSKLVFSQIKFTIQFTLWPYKGLYWHISVKDLEQEQTVRGTQDFCFFRVLFVVCIGVLCSKMFIRLEAEICSDVCGFDCEESHSAADEYTENERSKHSLFFRSSFLDFHSSGRKSHCVLHVTVKTCCLKKH